MPISPFLSLIFELSHGIFGSRLFEDLIEYMIDINCVLSDLNGGPSRTYCVGYDLFSIFNQLVVLDQLQLHGLRLQFEHLDLDVFIHNDQGLRVDLLELEEFRAVELVDSEQSRLVRGGNLQKGDALLRFLGVNVE